VAGANSWENLISEWDDKLQAAFLAAIYQIRDKAQFSSIVRMLEKGDVNGAIAAVGLNPADFRQFQKTFQDAIESGALAVAATVPLVGIIGGIGYKTFKFNANDPEVVRFVNDHLDSLTRQIIADQGDMLKAAFTNAAESGQSASAIAQDVLGIVKNGRRESGIVGLTSSQAVWADAYKAELASGDPAILAKALDRKARDARFDAAIKRALERSDRLPGSLQSNMVAAYRNRLLRQRAATIGRLEANVAVHEGQRQATVQALAEGGIQPNQIVSTWRSQRDERVRNTNIASHVYLDGQTAKWNQAFVGISGALLRYPGDPQAPIEETAGCRCHLLTSFNQEGK
jgi:hypothetical protein